ncbi:nucleoside diphosphate-linked moiety X motif 8, mitochondrial [Fopius arisanus]|uniref:Nucleoside diphosphate-linked moiety X motif 8, mitochondrial n=1 Tax=Fopius arisanus TaxID=64838 RepID=A0A9R1U9D6_9HYME|nr:PREDICTED: nucleoside diphosphate-linked moiety X motif 8, mitochondrial [Fopius arisanus]
MAINKYNAFRYFLRQRSTVIAQLAQNLSNQGKKTPAAIDRFNSEVILSTESRNECIKRLQKCPVMKSGHSEAARTAAVLVPLCIHNDEMGLLYTLRSTKLSQNKGEVSFPGGMRDHSDNSFEETALRETWEELNIPKNSVDVWSRANIVGRKHVHVMPVLGYIGHVDPQQLQFNPHEVEKAFVVSLQSLCDPNHWGFTQFRNNYTLPTYSVAGHKIWGLTALITHIILEALLHDVYPHKLQFVRPIEHYASKKV